MALPRLGGRFSPPLSGLQRPGADRPRDERQQAAPATQVNLATLVKRGHRSSNRSGYLACGMTGRDAWPTPKDRGGDRAGPIRAGTWGETVQITAGPTQEPLDPVRYISNRSSGKMGYALAELPRRGLACSDFRPGPWRRPAEVRRRPLNARSGDGTPARGHRDQGCGGGRLPPPKFRLAGEDAARSR